MFDDFLDLIGLGDDDSFDANESTLVDVEVTGVDYDGDGIFDEIDIIELHDLDGSGDADTMIMDVFTADDDLDFEHHGSSVVTDLDIDDDHITINGIEIDEVVDMDGVHIFATDDMFDFNIDDIQAGESGAYNVFDYDFDDDDDGMIGTPEADMDEWHVQETNSTCAVAAQEFVLEQLTGESFEESDLMELAEEMGWYDGGTAPADVGNILEYYGLDVEKSWGGTIDDIADCLNNGGKVIVGVDSSEMWDGVNDDFFAPGIAADHAIQVTGIDRSDPGNPMVIINDSGVANGCGAAVPLDLFMDAWEDSGCFMVEAYN